MRTFAAILHGYIQQRGMSQTRVAYGAGIDISYLSRIVRGDREPPRRDVVLALARELELPENETDDLLLAAGYPPLVLERVGMTNGTLLAVARVMDCRALTDDERMTFRAVVESIAARWLPQQEEKRSA